MKSNLWISIFSGLALPLALFIAGPWFNAFVDGKKSLEYHVEEKSPLALTFKQNSNWPGVTVAFNGRIINQGVQSSVAFSNSGSKSISTSDFESPIIIRINAHSKIIGSRVIKKSPGNLNIKLAYNDSSVIIDPLLLNPGDRFVVQTLSDSDINITSVNARILGVDSIFETKPVNNTGILLISSKQASQGWEIQTPIYAANHYAVFAIFVVLAFNMVYTYYRATKCESKNIRMFLMVFAMLNQVGASFLISILGKNDAFQKTIESHVLLLISGFVVVGGVFIMNLELYIKGFLLIRSKIIDVRKSFNQIQNK